MDLGVVPVHSGLTVLTTKGLIGSLAVWRYRAPMLTVVAQKWRGSGGDSHRVPQQWTW
jgi:hypothetical protein